VRALMTRHRSISTDQAVLLVWVKVWVKKGRMHKCLRLLGFQALKSRLVAGFSGAGLAYFW